MTRIVVTRPEFDVNAPHRVAWRDQVEAAARQAIAALDTTASPVFRFSYQPTTPIGAHR